MNHEAIDFLLQRMSVRIAAAHAEVLASPTIIPATATSRELAARDALQAKADGWRHELRGITRHLESRRHVIELRLNNRPGDASRQSLRERQRRLDLQTAATDDLWKRIDALLVDLVRLGIVLEALAEAFMQAAESIEKGAETHVALRQFETVIARTDQGGAGTPGAPGVAPFSALLLVVLSLRAMLLKL